MDLTQPGDPGRGHDITWGLGAGFPTQLGDLIQRPNMIRDRGPNPTRGPGPGTRHDPLTQGRVPHIRGTLYDPGPGSRPYRATRAREKI